MVKTNMYYEDNRDLAHDVQELSVELLGLPLHFLTDAGVFSKNAIDYGSRVLLDNFQPEGAKTLLDVGCGYGTLALTLAKKYDLKVTLVDVNSRALDLAKKNADKNNIKVDNIFLSNIYDNVEQSLMLLFRIPLFVREKKWYMLFCLTLMRI